MHTAATSHTPVPSSIRSSFVSMSMVRTPSGSTCLASWNGRRLLQGRRSQPSQRGRSSWATRCTPSARCGPAPRCPSAGLPQGCGDAGQAHQGQVHHMLLEHSRVDRLPRGALVPPGEPVGLGLGLLPHKVKVRAHRTSGLCRNVA